MSGASQVDPTSIDEAKALLYEHPLTSFVAERDVLVKRVRAAGNRDLANEIKGLRKPSAVAAEVNQVVRADPAGTELILQAADLLRSAQTGALEGSTIDASELQQHYRAAIQALSQSATTRRPEVRAALEAATIDEASNEDLRSGCLVVVPTPVSLFGIAPPPPAGDVAPAPVDELHERRARRAAKAKEKEHEQAAKKQAAESQRAVENAAAAEKQRAAKAEAQRKKDEKERQLKLKALKKKHRDALRSHVAELDAEEAAAAALEKASQTVAHAEDEHRALEHALRALAVRRAEAEEERVLADTTKAEASERAERAEADVDMLADAIAALETD